ncbi:hypothetical protein D9V30_02240 [Mycetocola reblochoni]|uniref:Uncharacterized protein n=1 Tax=Mycetocola reblochoni TaxID=331618 RepID=A0A3L6ZVY8_9MICO|nr:hypothetical protein D9V30_02240 [Mycetocola reblochoni]
MHNASGTTLGACTGSAALFVALGAVLSAANGDNLRAFLAFGTAITVAALMVAVVYCSNVIEISRIYPRSVVVWRGAKQRKRPVIQQRHGFSVKTYTIVRRRITWLGYGSLIALFVIYLCGLCMLVILVQ